MGDGTGFQIDDRMKIATAEGVAFDVQLAGLGSRGAAALIDAVIQGVIAVVIVIVVLTGTSGGTAIAVASVGLFLAVFGYSFLFEALSSGRTPGKQVIGLRVATLTGAQPGFAALATRNLLRLVDVLPTLYAVGALSIMVTARRQRLGDLAAGTVVIVTKTGAAASGIAAGAPLAAGTGMVHVPPGQHPTDAWDISRVTPQDVHAIRQLFGRRYALPQPTFAHLCTTYAERLRPLVSGGEHLPPEAFLAWLLEAKRRR